MIQTHRTPRPPATPEEEIRNAFCRVASGVSLSRNTPEGCQQAMLAALSRAADCLTNAICELSRGDLARVDYLDRMANEHCDTACRAMVEAYEAARGVSHG